MKEVKEGGRRTTSRTNPKLEKIIYNIKYNLIFRKCDIYDRDCVITCLNTAFPNKFCFVNSSFFNIANMAVCYSVEK